MDKMTMKMEQQDLIMKVVSIKNKRSELNSDQQERAIA